MGRWRSTGILSLVVAGVMLAGCEQAGEAAVGEMPPREVQTVVVRAEPLARVAELPGRVEPVRVAEVRARVAGIVVQKRFEEGADVKVGDLLFQIDPAPLKAALARAEGELARAEATLYEARARVRRYEPLVKIEAVSRQDYDSATADLRSAEAATRSARADVETARLNLGYASVTAPISGRIGRALVTEGALVGQGDATLMARIQQLDPVYVDFTQPAAEVLRLRESLKAGGLDGSGDLPLSLRVEGTDHEATGEWLFTDVSVDPGTGQVALRGRFANPGKLLLPGMYVRVLAPQGIDRKALLVPQRAVQRGADGVAQVLVVGSDGRAEARAVETGVMQGARWQVLHGLQPGDQVIVSGLAGLQPGAGVVVRPAADQQAARQ